MEHQDLDALQADCLIQAQLSNANRDIQKILQSFSHVQTSNINFHTLWNVGVEFLSSELQPEYTTGTCLPKHETLNFEIFVPFHQNETLWSFFKSAFCLSDSIQPTVQHFTVHCSTAETNASLIELVIAKLLDLYISDDLKHDSVRHTVVKIAHSFSLKFFAWHEFILYNKDQCIGVNRRIHTHIVESAEQNVKMILLLSNTSSQDEISSDETALQRVTRFQSNISRLSKTIQSSKMNEIFSSWENSPQRIVSCFPQYPQHAAKRPFRIRVRWLMNCLTSLLHAKVPPTNTADIKQKKSHHKSTSSHVSTRSIGDEQFMDSPPSTSNYSINRSESRDWEDSSVIEHHRSGSAATHIISTDNPIQIQNRYSVAYTASRVSRSPSKSMQVSTHPKLSTQIESSPLAQSMRTLSIAPNDSPAVTDRSPSSTARPSKQSKLLLQAIKSGVVMVPGTNSTVRVSDVFVRFELVHGLNVLPGCSAESKSMPFSNFVEWRGAQFMFGHVTDLFCNEWITMQRDISDIPPETILHVSILGRSDPSGAVQLPEPVLLGWVRLPICSSVGHFLSGTQSVELWPGNMDPEMTPVGPFRGLAANEAASLVQHGAQAFVDLEELTSEQINGHEEASSQHTSYAAFSDSEEDEMDDSINDTERLHSRLDETMGSELDLALSRVFAHNSAEASTTLDGFELDNSTTIDVPIPDSHVSSQYNFNPLTISFEVEPSFVPVIADQPPPTVESSAAIYALKSLQDIFTSAINVDISPEDILRFLDIDAPNLDTQTDKMDQAESTFIGLNSSIVEPPLSSTQIIENHSASHVSLADETNQNQPSSVLSSTCTSSILSSVTSSNQAHPIPHQDCTTVDSLNHTIQPNTNSFTDTQTTSHHSIQSTPTRDVPKDVVSNHSAVTSNRLLSLPSFVSVARSATNVSMDESPTEILVRRPLDPYSLHARISQMKALIPSISQQLVVSRKYSPSFMLSMLTCFFSEHTMQLPFFTATVSTYPDAWLVSIPNIDYAVAGRWIHDTGGAGFYDTLPYGANDTLARHGPASLYSVACAGLPPLPMYGSWIIDARNFYFQLNQTLNNNSITKTPTSLICDSFETFVQTLPGSVHSQTIAPINSAGVNGMSGLYLENEYHIALEKCGWMRKLGPRPWSRWKRRWFELSEETGTLIYFASNMTPDSVPKGIIVLAGMHAKRRPDMNRTYQRVVGSTRKTLSLHCFEIFPRSDFDTETSWLVQNAYATDTFDEGAGSDMSDPNDSSDHSDIGSVDGIQRQHMLPRSALQPIEAMTETLKHGRDLDVKIFTADSKRTFFLFTDSQPALFDWIDAIHTVAAAASHRLKLASSSLRRFRQLHSEDHGKIDHTSTESVEKVKRPRKSIMRRLTIGKPLRRKSLYNVINGETDTHSDVPPGIPKTIAEVWSKNGPLLQSAIQATFDVQNLQRINHPFMLSLIPSHNVFNKTMALSTTIEPLQSHPTARPRSRRSFSIFGRPQSESRDISLRRADSEKPTGRASKARSRSVLISKTSTAGSGISSFTDAFDKLFDVDGVASDQITTGSFDEFILKKETPNETLPNTMDVDYWRHVAKLCAAYETEKVPSELLRGRNVDHVFKSYMSLLHHHQRMLANAAGATSGNLSVRAYSRRRSTKNISIQQSQPMTTSAQASTQSRFKKFMGRIRGTHTPKATQNGDHTLQWKFGGLEATLSGDLGAVRGELVIDGEVRDCSELGTLLGSKSNHSERGSSTSQSNLLSVTSRRNRIDISHKGNVNQQHPALGGDLVGWTSVLESLMGPLISDDDLVVNHDSQLSQMTLSNGLRDDKNTENDLTTIKDPLSGQQTTFLTEMVDNISVIFKEFVTRNGKSFNRNSVVDDVWEFTGVTDTNRTRQSMYDSASKPPLAYMNRLSTLKSPLSTNNSNRVLLRSSSRQNLNAPTPDRKISVSTARHYEISSPTLHSNSAVGSTRSSLDISSRRQSTIVHGTLLPHVLEKIFASDSLYRMTLMDRTTLWQHRHHVVCRPEGLSKLAMCISWCSRVQKRELHRLLYTWSVWQRTDLPRYLELLDAAIGDTQVRHFACKCLEQLSTPLFAELVPQMVQALKYEPHLLSSLFQMLFRKAIAHPWMIGVPLFWCLMVEGCSHISCFGRFSAYINNLSIHLSPPVQRELTQQQQLWGKHGIFAGICQFIKVNKRVGKARRKQLLWNALDRIIPQLPQVHSLPYDPAILVSKLIVSKCKVMDSAKLPLWLVFERYEPYTTPDEPNSTDSVEDAEEQEISFKSFQTPGMVQVMFKSGDDIRQDTLTLQMLAAMDRWWQNKGLDLRMTLYRCLSTWDDGGLVEIVQNAATMAQIQVSQGGKFGAYRDNVLVDWLIEQNGPMGSPSYEKAVDNFIRSSAGYCAATYVLGIGDRHNDNLMVKRTGQFFHIDFGHILGNFKYQFGIARERSAFVFTPEMAAVMGGKGAPGYIRFVDLASEAYAILRAHSAELVNMLLLMLPSCMPELRNREDIEFIRHRLALDLPAEVAVARFKKEVDRALANRYKRLDDTIHIFVHG